MPGRSTPLGPFTGGFTNKLFDPAAVDDSNLLVADNMLYDYQANLFTRYPIIQEETLGTSELEVVLWESIPTAVGSDIITDVLVVTNQQGTWVSTGGEAFTKISNHYLPVATLGRRSGEVAVWFACSPNAASTGGYWELGKTSVTTVSTIPVAQSVVYYKTRLYFGGLKGGTNRWSGSIVAYSKSLPIGEDADFEFLLTDSPDTNDLDRASWVPVAAQDGQTINAMIVYFDTILVFKDNSVHVWSSDGDVDRAQQKVISNTVGAAGQRSVLIYNDVVFVLYERYLHRFTGQSFAVVNTSVYIEGTGSESLSIFEDRMIARRGTNYYVFHFETEAWTTWSTSRPFNYLVEQPGHLNTAFTRFVGGLINGSSLVSINTKFNAGWTENFTARVQTKYYTFEVTDFFKRLFGWSVHLKHVGAVRGAVDAVSEIPESSVVWDSTSSPDAITASPYGYVYKFLKAYRFRQVSFAVELETDGRQASMLYKIVPVLRVAQYAVAKAVTSA